MTTGIGKPAVWDVDEVPTLLVTRAEHWLPGGLHWNQMGTFADDARGMEAILNKLDQAYDNAGRQDLVKVVQEWRKTIE